VLVTFALVMVKVKDIKSCNCNSWTVAEIKHTPLWYNPWAIHQMHIRPCDLQKALTCASHIRSYCSSYYIVELRPCTMA